MSLENAKRNLEEFGKELNLQGLVFDENNTCILGIDDEFSLHLTYEPNSKRLYLYSPLLDGLPTDEKILLRLYERLLEGSMLGGQMAGGGVGVAVKEGLILMHCTLDMEFAQENLLKAFAPLYVETVERWRKTCREIKEGIDTGPGIGVQPAQGIPKAPAPPKIGGKEGGQGFIKV